MQRVYQMSHAIFEYTLARLLTDETFLQTFKDFPEATLSTLELTAEERSALLKMNQDDLTMAARSFATKKKKCHTN